MKTLIQQKLKEVEKQYQVKILYACETGSRAWGFVSPDSDYDVRFIYKHETNWYLTLQDKKDSIEYISNDGIMDLSGWDIKKCLKLLWKSNGALLERCQSPIVYMNTNETKELLWEYAAYCFSPIATLYHYLGMAKTSQAKLEGKTDIKLKTLFYTLRALLACKWIIEKDSIPPIVFATMVNELALGEHLKIQIHELVVLKSGKDESYMHPAKELFSVFIIAEMIKIENMAQTMSGRKQKEVDLDSLFRKILAFEYV